jgi:hypothetical protein
MAEPRRRGASGLRAPLPPRAAPWLQSALSLGGDVVCMCVRVCAAARGRVCSQVGWHRRVRRRGPVLPALYGAGKVLGAWRRCVGAQLARGRHGLAHTHRHPAPGPMPIRVPHPPIALCCERGSAQLPRFFLLTKAQELCAAARARARVVCFMRASVLTDQGAGPFVQPQFAHIVHARSSHSTTVPAPLPAEALQLGYCLCRAVFLLAVRLHCCEGGGGGWACRRCPCE